MKQQLLKRGVQVPVTTCVDRTSKSSLKADLTSGLSVKGARGLC